VAMSAYNSINTSALSPDVAAMPSGPLDAYESDDTPDDAKPIFAGAPQDRSLHVRGDVDWVTFTLSAPSDVILATAGTAGNTFATLYDDALTVLASDDDGGVGAFSRVAAPYLPAGLYFGMVRAATGTGAIAAYTLTLTATSPPAPPTGL